MMSPNVFLTLCIVGIDCLVYFLFQWTYGDKRGAMARKIAAIRKAAESQPPRPYVVGSQISRRGVLEMRAREQAKSVHSKNSYERQLAGVPSPRSHISNNPLEQFANSRAPQAAACFTLKS
jgi:hypothetical protein